MREPLGRVARAALMPIAVEYDTELLLLRVRLAEVWPSIEEVRALRERLITEGLLTERTLALIDIRRVDVSTAPRYREVMDAIRAAIEQGGLPRRRAYLADEGVQFGIIRMIQMMAEPHGFEVGVFVDEAEAERWLLDRQGLAL